MKSIGARELYSLMQADQNIFLIDVRNSDEYQKMHIPKAILHPLPQLSPEKIIEDLAARGLENNEIYVTCASGKRAEMACQLLHAEKYPHVTLVEGGTLAWFQAGLPVEGDCLSSPA